MKPGGSGLLLAVVAAAVLVAVIAGFLALGTPQEERRRQIDARRIEDLQAIANDVQTMYGASDGGETLPDSLAQIVGPIAPNVGRRDPVTNAAYPYRKLDPDRFELCATFDLPAEDAGPRRYDGGWGHGAGQVCFEFKMRRQQAYPVRPSATRPSVAPASPPIRPSGVH